MHLYLLTLSCNFYIRKNKKQHITLLSTYKLAINNQVYIALIILL